MKLRLLILAAAFFIVGLAARPADATTYYVAANGNDANTCLDPAHACKTPQGVTAKLLPGDTAQFCSTGGIFRINGPWTFTSANSGTIGAPITYTNCPGQSPIITGTIPPTPLTWALDAAVPCAGSCTLYSTVLDADPSHSTHFNNFEALFYNGVRRPVPRANQKNGCPNTNNPTMCVAGATQAAADAACGCPSTGCAFPSAPCAAPTPNMCFNKFMYNGSDISGAWHNIGIGDIEIKAFEIWSMETMRLKTAAGGTATLSGPMWNSNGLSGCMPGHEYLTWNVRELLTAGQWYLDRCPTNASCTVPELSWKLYVAALPGENPNSDTIYFPQTDPAGDPRLLVANGLQYNTFSGLTFEGDNYLPPPQGLADSQGMPLIPAALSFTNSSNIILDSDQVYHIQGKGIEFIAASSNIQVQNSVVYDIAAGGIFVGKIACPSPGAGPGCVPDTDSNVPSNVSIYNNAVDYVQRIYPTGEATGIYVGDAHHVFVDHNEIKGTYSGCINLGHGLNRGQLGGTTAFFMYDLWATNNLCEGQGVGGLYTGILNDFGGIYLASNLSSLCPAGTPTPGVSASYCQHVIGNVIHDLASNYTNLTAAGARGLYFDQGTSKVEGLRNLIYRVADQCFFNNTPSHGGGNPAAVYLPQYNLLENNILAGCGASVNPAQRVLNRGGDNPSSFFGDKNVFYYNSQAGATPQSQPGHWGCFDYNPASPTFNQAVPCNTQWLLASNDWFDVAHAPLDFVTCLTTGCQSGNNHYSTLPWVGEDIGSISVDPGFINPTYPVDDWHVTQLAALAGIGFVPFDYRLAGRTNISATIVATATANNTPSCTGNLQPTAGCNAAFLGLSTLPANIGAQTVVIDPAPQNVSTVNAKLYLYPGWNGRLLCHWMPWFSNISPFNGHLNIGMNENIAANATAQVSSMLTHGCDVVNVDWKGTTAGQAFSLASTAALFTDVTSRPSFPLHFMITVDQGAVSPLCPTGASDQTACLSSTLNSLLDFIRTTYTATAAYEKDATGHPLVAFFIDEASWSGSNWVTVMAAVRAHVDAYPFPFKLFKEFGDFTEAGFDGAFAWPQPAPWSITNQFCYDRPTCPAIPLGPSYLDSFYSQALANPTKVPIGVLYKGFDDSMASFGTNRVTAQQSGGVMRLTGQAPALYGWSTGNQLPYVQIATWNDYEEGTEVETGIDNSYTLTASITANNLSWVLVPADATYANAATIDHYAIWYGTSLTSLSLAQDNIPVTTSTLPIQSIIPAGSWQVYVQMVGKPLVINRMSNGTAYAAGTFPGPPLLGVPVQPNLLPVRNINAATDYLPAGFSPSTFTLYGKATGAGQFTIGGGSAGPTPNVTATLPQFWVNQHDCDGALLTPDVVKTVRVSGGDYACSQTAMQQAMDDSEARRVATNQSTRIDVDNACTLTITGQAKTLTMGNQGYIGNKCIAIDAVTHLRRGVQVGTVALSACFRSSGTVFCTSIDPHGLISGDAVLIENVGGGNGTSFNNTANSLTGYVVTVTDSTHFNYVQPGGALDATGTISPFLLSRVTGFNTLAQQAATDFFKIVISGDNAAAIQGDNGAHHWAWFDTDISTSASVNDTPLVLLGNASDDAHGYTGQGFHMGLDQFYIHGCMGTGVPTTIPIWPAHIPCATERKTKNAIRWLGGYIWIMNGMTDQMVYQGVESHSIGSFTGQGPVKIVNNHARTGSTIIHHGGTAPTITGLVPSDAEIRLNTAEQDPNVLGISACGVAGSRQWVIKNDIEVKDGQRFLIRGNRFRYSWCDAQSGSLMLLTVRGDGYWSAVKDITLENNLFEHGQEWIELTGRDNASSGSGMSMPGQRELIRNNMVVDIANPIYSISAGSSTAVSLGGAGDDYLCTANRLGNVTTLSNCVCQGSSCPFTGITTGDMVHTTSCTDPSLQVSRTTLALSSNPFSTGPITYANVGPDVPSATCTLNNSQGHPSGIEIANNTIITQNVGAGVRILFSNTASAAGGIDREVPRGISIHDNIMARTGGAANSFFCPANTKEGTATGFFGACLDLPSFQFHHMALFGPKPNVNNYSQWNPIGVETHTPLTNVNLQTSAACPGTPTQTCAGFVGNFATAAAIDYHDYKLRSDSYYALGQPGVGSNGKDLGVDLIELDGAMVEGQYVCTSACGTTGPYPQ